MRTTVIINLAKFTIITGILYYLITSGRLNFERLLLFRQHPLILITLSAALILWLIPLSAFRWWLLLKAIGVSVPLSRAFVLTWIGNFFSTTLPGNVSGDVVKGYYIVTSQEKGKKVNALITLIIDRFVGLFGLIAMAFMTILFNLEWILTQSNLQFLVWVISGLFWGFILLFVVVFFSFGKKYERLIRLLKKLPGHPLLVKVYLAFKGYQYEKSTLFFTVLISIVIHSSIALIFFQIATLIGVHNLDIVTQLFIMPIGMIALAIPIAPAGIGVGHATFDYFYQLVGVTGGADIFNLYVIILLTVNLMGGIPYLFFGSENKILKLENI